MKQMLIVFSSLLFLFGFWSIGLCAQDQQVEPNASKRAETGVYERINLPDRSWMEIAHFTSKGKEGIKDRSGNIIVRPVYDEISRFQSFDTAIIAKVKRAGKWGLIDIIGTVQTIALLRLTGKKGHANSAGREIIPPKYDEIGDFHYGAMVARVRLNGKWGYVNSTGREIVPPKYDEIGDFRYRAMVARVRLNGKWGYVNGDGREIITPKYDEIGDFAPLADRNPDQITQAGNDMLGLVVRIRLKDKWGYVDAGDKEVVPIKYDELPDVNRLSTTKLIRVKLNGKYGYLDSTGKEVTPAKYDEAPERLYEKNFKTRVLRRVTQNGKYGYLDRETGEEVIPPRYDIGPEFLSEEKNRVKRDGKWGYVDSQGREVSPFVAEPDPCVYAKKKGDNYVFGDETIMRSTPDVSSEIITRLPAGGKIKVISNTSTDANFGDEIDSWYQVEDLGKVGFVWGGNLADSAFTVPVDGKERLFLIRNRTNGTNLCYKPKFEIKMLQDGKKIAEYSGHPFTRVSAGAIKSIDYISMEGFSAPLYLLRVTYDYTGYRDTLDRSGTGIVYFDVAHGKLNKVLELIETTGESESTKVKFSHELVLPGNRTQVDQIFVDIFVSSAQTGRQLFLRRDYRWDWNERTFKEKY